MAATRLEHWRQWRERCALALCDDETRAVLSRFGAMRFRGYLDRWRVRAAAYTPPMPEPDDAWHWLEVYMTVPSVGIGKRYKQWLFVQAEQRPPLLNALESGASVLMRTVVCQYVCEHAPPRHSVSLDQVVAGSAEAPVTLGDCLPASGNPRSEAARREQEALALRHAQALAPTLTPRERMALTARALGVSMRRAAASGDIPCRRAVLNATYRKLAQRLFKELEASYPDRKSVV